MPPRTPPLPTTALTEGLFNALKRDYDEDRPRLERGAQLQRTGKVTQWWQNSSVSTVYLKAECVSQDARSIVFRDSNKYLTHLSMQRLTTFQQNSAADCLIGMPAWDNLCALAASVNDELAFNKCAAAQSLASRCVKEISKDLSAQLVPFKWHDICHASCNCGDYQGGNGHWCKHVAALLCELMHKLNTSCFLYLKLLGVDVYLLATSPRPSETKEEEEEEEPTRKRHKGSSSGSREDPICV
eukprot:CAMPEP_0183351252 /NCGR_PEP_ID=MMETSP0164_2-20130417/23448_1 /TAXON_ID=221442 /ORGANISM="Coccolithus pelagicus ssp braarudi, Strain PLY182g" /LENGTH=241 /DNA_ID=CAMNT_0025523373 /DNA_START=36 /DNA_END=761 /DNA_ORIENTATION=+